MASAEELLAQLASGVPLEELARRATDPGLADLVDRCAWVRSFDRAVFERLRESVPAAADVTFEQVIAHPDVRPVPGPEPGAFSVRGDARRAALGRLAGHGVPQELVRLSAWLAEHFRATGAELSELEMLIVADPRAARTRLRELYRAADERFDAARCQALIDLVHERGDVADWELVGEQNRLERYLTARLYWRDAYRRTSRFLPPGGTRDAFSALLAPGGPGTLQLFGTGGMGKTMHLQALVARYAVPEPARLACSIVDFDLVKTGNALRRPWLLLVELAHQLNQQLYEPLFDSFLVQHGKLRAHLLLPHLLGDAVPGQLGLDPGEDDRLAEDVRREFFQIAGDEAIGSRLLLAFDTLERVTHVDATLAADDPRALFDQLATLRRRLPGARMVFSGRYDLRAEIPDLDPCFWEMQHLQLHRLRADEARRYLVERRKLRVGGDVIDAAIDAASRPEEGALPFKLALLADAAAQDPRISADEIRKLRDPGVIYVLKRVVDRIEDFRLRWLLLFGVIPRLLSRGFVAEVMAPYLEQAVRGTSPEVGASLTGTPADGSFRSEPHADVDVDALWKKLTRYAASYAWIELVAPDVLRFHPDVVHPLQDLIRRDPVFARLNADAAAYFERRADAAGEDRPRMLREALFHRAALEGAGVLERWRAQVRRIDADPAVVAALADEIIELGRDPGTALDAAAVAEARTERALANLRLATAPGARRGGDVWDRVREDVERAERVLPAPRPRLAAAQAALHVHDGHAVGAIGILDAALAEWVAREDRILLRVRYGDALALVGDRAADEHYGRALSEVRELGARPEDVATLAWRRAAALDRCDDLTAAIAACDEALAQAPAGGAAHAAVSLLRGQACLRVGEPSSCRSWAEAPLAFGGRLAHEARMLVASAELAMWEPERALATADELVRLASSGSEAAEAGIHVAQARELRGIVRARLLDHAGAVEDLEAAGLVWDSISSEGARRCHARIAEIHLRDFVDPDRAMLALIRAEKVPGHQAGVDIAAVDLRRAEWRAVTGTGSPEPLVDEALAVLAEHRAAPSRRALAALDALALPGERAPARWLEVLTGALAEIRPAAARLALLEDLERCPVLEGRYDAGELHRLRRLLTGAGVTKETERLPARDRHLLLVRLAEVARALGRLDEARRLLGEAAGVLPAERCGAYARRRFLAAGLRAGAHDLVADVAQLEAREPRRPHTGLSAALLIEAGERLLDDVRSHTVAEHVLKSAADVLAARGEHTGRWPARLQHALTRLGAHGGRPRPARPATPTAPGEPIATGPAIDVLVALRDGALHVHGEGPEARFERAQAGTKLVELLLRASERHGEIDHELAYAFADPAAAGALLGEALVGPGTAEHLRGHVRIWTEGGVLDQIPWELARTPPPGRLLALETGVEHLYRGQRSARRAERSAGNKPPRVLLVRPLARDRRLNRGMIKTTLVPLEDHYRRRGVGVTALETVDLATLERAIEKVEPDVVHVVGAFVDASGGAAIDISSGTAGTLELLELEKERLTTTGLALALTRPTKVDPIVILDPPALTRVAGLASQLLLRNAFAAELASIAAVPAIIATGLVSYRAQEALYDTLTRELAAGQPVADVVDRVRARGEDALAEDGYGLAATALFTAEPGHSLV